MEVHEEIYKYRVVKNPVISRFFRLPTVDDAPDFESRIASGFILQSVIRLNQKRSLCVPVRKRYRTRLSPLTL